MSANLVYALEYAKNQGSKIVGVVGRNGGYTKKVADACCVIPTVNDLTITPHTEGFQAVIWCISITPSFKSKRDKMGISVIENKAVFIDRDGVINLPRIIDGKSYPPSDVSELEIYPDVLGSSRNLKSLGYLLIVVTNQPDVSRGKTSKKTVEEINNVIFKSLPIDEIKICYHDDHHSCNCRKPLPGMLTSAASDYALT